MDGKDVCGERERVMVGKGEGEAYCGEGRWSVRERVGKGEEVVNIKLLDH